jgi:predicted phosphodiesterase
MKFAAIADVHGNCTALEAVLADIAAAGIGEVVNLGDHVSGPLEPRRTADLLMARGFPSIRGNHDRALVQGAADMGPSDRHAYAQLDAGHVEWLASLPATLQYRDDVLLCHGTPRDDESYWLERVTDSGTVVAAPIGDVEAAATGDRGVADPVRPHAHTSRRSPP